MQTVNVLGMMGNALTSSASTIGGYTVPAASSAIVTPVLVTNVTGSPVQVSVLITNGSLGHTIIGEIPANSTSSIFGSGVVALAAGWYIQAYCPTSGAAFASMSVTQFT